MVKLASARDFRLYGPVLSRYRGEYTNAGLYVFATVLLLGGFVAQLSKEPKSGIVLMPIALGLLLIVNMHDLMAHLTGIDYWFPLMRYDTQLVLVEFAVPLVQALGSLVFFFGALFVFIQEEKGYDYYKLENHSLNLLVAGSALWVMGSIHNSCQIYERAVAHVQILQQSVCIPFLIGSVLFLSAAILNRNQQSGLILIHHGLDLLGWTWVWLGIVGSLLLFIGGITNVFKVLRLEKLHGGARETAT